MLFDGILALSNLGVRATNDGRESGPSSEANVDYDARLS